MHRPSSGQADQDEGQTPRRCYRLLPPAAVRGFHRRPCYDGAECVKDWLLAPFVPVIHGAERLPQHLTGASVGERRVSAETSKGTLRMSLALLSTTACILTCMHYGFAHEDRTMITRAADSAAGLLSDLIGVGSGVGALPVCRKAEFKLASMLRPPSSITRVLELSSLRLSLIHI